MILSKYGMLGDRYFHYFKNGDSVVRVSCTKEEYLALGLKDAGPATHPLGYVWLHSTTEPEFDTINGDLPDDSYASVSADTIAVKIKDKPDVVIIPKYYLTEGATTSEADDMGVAQGFTRLLGAIAITTTPL